MTGPGFTPSEAAAHDRWKTTPPETCECQDDTTCDLRGCRCACHPWGITEAEAREEAAEERADAERKGE